MSKPPSSLRKQFQLYEREGFTVKSFRPSSRHWKVVFHQFSQAQYLTINGTDVRGIKNNIARFKRLAKEEGK